MSRPQSPRGIPWGFVLLMMGVLTLFGLGVGLAVFGAIQLSQIWVTP